MISYQVRSRSATKVRLRSLNTLSERKMFVVEFVVHIARDHDPDPLPKPSLARKGQGHPPSEVRLGPWPHRMVPTFDRGGLRGGAPPPLLTNREAAVERESTVGTRLCLQGPYVWLCGEHTLDHAWTRSLHASFTATVRFGSWSGLRSRQVPDLDQVSELCYPDQKPERAAVWRERSARDL